jgi:hypothetical protein
MSVNLFLKGSLSHIFQSDSKDKITSLSCDDSLQPAHLVMEDAAMGRETNRSPAGLRMFVLAPTQEASLDSILRWGIISRDSELRVS